jgi:hypothetical protein
MENLKILRLHVKKEYFEDIQNNSKKFEYRLFNDYWKKRLINKKYDEVHVFLGYPSVNDLEKVLKFTYYGYEIKNIVHKHFGNDEVKVFAIKLYYF